MVPALEPGLHDQCAPWSFPFFIPKGVHLNSEAACIRSQVNEDVLN